ncbi:MAG: MBL fold metallo-hydrolase [Omnitrophica bacterium]|nr:MBL fold metallo-hydrolase [Candidatus Omnitrophota bacterium]
MIEVKAFVVGMLETNCYLVYSKGQNTGFLIDPGLYDKRIKNTIEKEGIRIKNIINTHGHADHTGGNKEFGYPVLIHEYDNELLKNPPKELAFFADMASPAVPASGLLKDKDIIKEGEIELEVIHTPGHTPGGICLKMGERIFTGDTLFRDGVGRTDFDYGSEKDLLNSIQGRLMVFGDETKILPGHGPGSTIGHERRNNQFLC